MSRSDGVRCLDDELSEYAAGRLVAGRARAWERHLAVCDLCVAGLESERRLRAALAGAPSMPGDLRDSLMALGRGPAPDVPGGSRAAAEPLVLLAPSAPACHRSALRAAMVAAAAAGISAAAAWSLTVLGAPVPGRPGLVSQPVVRDAAATSRSSATPTVRSVARWSTAGAVLVVDDQQAQSGP